MTEDEFAHFQQQIEDRDIRIAELETELEASQECELDVNRAMRKRLAAVIALCDYGAFYGLRENVRAAATSDP